MHKRKLLIGLLVAGLFTAGLGAGLVPASAEPHTFRVTFAGGTSTVVTLDIPPGTPAAAAARDDHHGAPDADHAGRRAAEGHGHAEEGQHVRIRTGREQADFAEDHRRPEA